MAVKPKLCMIPSGYKGGASSGDLYSVLPSYGVGDFDFSRSGSATRINKDGLIETVASNVPRLNYPLIDGVVSGCPSLLLEPESANLLPYSEDFTQWTNIGSPTVELNNIISPNGTLNGTKVTRGTNTTLFRQITSPIIGIEHTFSIYAKKGNYDKLTLDIGDEIAPTFTLTDEWQRFEVTSTPSINHVDISLPLSSSGDFIYIYGAMLESGSFPTSYIPTSGSQATRSAETCNNAGDANTFNDSEGVLFGEVNFLSPSDTSLLEINDGSANNRVSIYSDSGVLSVNAFNGASNTLTSPSTDILNYNKVVISYKLNEVKMYVNGILIGTNNVFSGFSASLSNMETSLSGGAIPFYGNTKQIQYFDTALTDTDLEELTSWTSFSEMARGQLYSIQ